MAQLSIASLAKIVGLLLSYVSGMASHPARAIHRIQGISAVADGAVLTTVILYFSVHVHLPEQQVGLVLSASAAVALVLAAPLGRLSDRIGLRRSAVVHSVAIAVAFAGYAVAQTLWAYAVAGILFGLARSGSAATIQAIVAAHSRSAERVAERARLHTVLNAGFGLGSVVGAVVLAAARPTLFVVLFAAGALTAMASAVMLGRLHLAPTGPVGRRPRERRSAFHDRRLVTVTGLAAVLQLTMPILSVLLPLWLVTRTEAPAWAAAVAFGLNTLLVLLLQTRWSARVRTDASAAGSALVAGVTITLACVLFAMMPYGGAVAATVLALTGVAVMSVGEIAAGPAAWHLALRDTPTERQGEYQAVFGMSTSIARILGPLAALPLVTGLGVGGWLAITGVILAASCALAAVGGVRTGRRRSGPTPAGVAVATPRGDARGVAIAPASS